MDKIEVIRLKLDLLLNSQKYTLNDMLRCLIKVYEIERLKNDNKVIIDYYNPTPINYN